LAQLGGTTLLQTTPQYSTIDLRIGPDAVGGALFAPSRQRRSDAAWVAFKNGARNSVWAWAGQSWDLGTLSMSDATAS
jgi:hypothetical protein